MATKNGVCNETMAYVSDFFQPALLVYSFSDDNSWRVNHPTFAVEDAWSKYTFGSNNIIIPFGVLSITLTPDHKFLIYRALSAENEYIVSTDILNNKNNWNDQNESRKMALDGYFQSLGSRETRCSTGVMDSSFNYYCIAEKYSAISYWNLKHPETGTNLLLTDKTYLSDPGCLKIIVAPDGNEELFIVKSSIIVSFLYQTLCNIKMNLFCRKFLLVTTTLKNLISFLVAVGLQTYWLKEIVLHFCVRMVNVRIKPYNLI